VRKISLLKKGTISPIKPALLDPTLVLYLPFSEGYGTTAKDRSRYRDDGTIYGASWVDGKIGKALNFDGVDDFVESPHNSIYTFTTEPFSVAFWAYLISFVEEYGRPINKGEYLVDGWYVTFHGAGFNNIYFVDGQSGQIFITLPNTVPIGVWTHWTFTRDGSVPKWYKNGYELALDPAGSTVYIDSLASTKTLRFGLGPTSNQKFNGILDEVRIYNRALTAQEILNLYNASVV